VVDAIISAMVGAMVGVIAFVVVKNIVDAQNQDSWEAQDTAIMTILPTALGILVLVGMFSALRAK